MRFSDISSALSPETKTTLGKLKRRYIYHIKDVLSDLPFRNNYDNLLVQVTHFHKTALRCKVLASPFSISSRRPNSRLSRRMIQRDNKGIDTTKPALIHIFSIPYNKIPRLTFEEVPIDKLPTYINQATPLYARYIEEIRKNLIKEESDESKKES